MSGKYKGFVDVLTGFLLGAGTLKIYYESIDTDNGRESFIFRKNKQKIDEICSTHDNLKFGKDQRRITSQQKLTQRWQKPDANITKFGIPEGSHVILRYKNHVLAYDFARKIPLWVAEHLTAEKIQNGVPAQATESKAERTKSSFRPDPNIPIHFQSRNEDYFRSGWTRGHMAPAGTIMD